MAYSRRKPSNNQMVDDVIEQSLFQWALDYKRSQSIDVLATRGRANRQRSPSDECEVEMRYCRPRNRDESSRQGAEVTATQAGNVVVYKGFLRPNETFTFISKRGHRDRFELSLYVDGRVDSQISACCEFKNADGHRLGGKHGHFAIERVRGAQPCHGCQATYHHHCNSASEDSDHGQQRHKSLSSSEKSDRHHHRRKSAEQRTNKKSVHVEPEKKYSTSHGRQTREAREKERTSTGKTTISDGDGCHKPSTRSESPTESKKQHSANTPATPPNDIKYDKKKRQTKSPESETNAEKLRSAVNTTNPTTSHQRDLKKTSVVHEPAPPLASASRKTNQVTTSEVTDEVPTSPHKRKQFEKSLEPMNDEHTFPLTQGQSSIATGELTPALARILQRSKNIFPQTSDIVVWVDPDMQQSEESVQWYAQLIRTVNDLHTFENADDCFAFITPLTNVRILLIVANTLAQVVISRADSIASIKAIYISCTSDKDDQLQSDYVDKPKVHGTFTDVMTLCNRLKRDLTPLENSDISISVTSVGSSPVSTSTDNTGCNNGSTETNNQLEASFVYAELLKDMFVKMNYPADVHKNFCVLWRRMVKANPNNKPIVLVNRQIEFIDKLEYEYHEHDPVWWYSHQMQLYYLLNRALREQDVDMLYLMRFFIKDLHQQLVELHPTFVSTLNHGLPPLFRGVVLSDDDFRSIRTNIGGLISFNNFLSTSMKREVGENFANSPGQGQVSVLFVFSVDVKKCRSPFADIRHLSYFGKEAEVLFSMGTIFRIDNVTSSNDNTWEIQLTATDQDDEHLSRLLKQMRRQTQSSNPLLSLGSLLYHMGKYTQSIDIYRDLYEDPSTKENWRLLATCCVNMGLSYQHNGDYVNALEKYEQALATELKHLPPGHADLASTYNNLGSLQYDLGDYTSALRNSKKALDILKKSGNLDARALASYTNNIGSIYQKLKKHDEALDYFKHVLAIEEKCLMPNDPALSTTYNNIGGSYYAQEQYAEALEYYTQALKIRQRALPSTHPDLGSAYGNLATALDGLGRHEEAEECVKKAVHIFQVSLPPESPQRRGTEAYLRKMQAQKMLHDIFAETV